MPTFDTPEPISATVELTLGDVRISASERIDTVVGVEPSDASNDEDRKAVVYEPVRLTQDFRNFDFLSPWEAITTLPGDEKVHAARAAEAAPPAAETKA